MCVCVCICVACCQLPRHSFCLFCLPVRPCVCVVAYVLPTAVSLSFVYGCGCVFERACARFHVQLVCTGRPRHTHTQSDRDPPPVLLPTVSSSLCLPHIYTPSFCLFPFLSLSISLTLTHTIHLSLSLSLSQHWHQAGSVLPINQPLL